MKNLFSFMALALMTIFGFVLSSCSDDSKDSGNGTVTNNSYSVDLPSGTSGVKIEPLSNEEVNKLKSQGYKIVGTPVNVTQDGNDHVLLSKMATVSFKIPEDFPKEKYGELVGVLITDEGPEYIIPDLDALDKGYVKFQTIHFCKTMTVQDQEKLNEQFSEYVAVHDWDNDLRESTFNKLGDKLKEAIDIAGYSENDLLGITMREVLSSNDFVNTTMEYIKHYDSGTLTDNAIKDVSEKLENELKKKTLSVLFTKLKKEPGNKAVKETLEKYLTKDNMEKAGTLLGSEDPASVAVDFAKSFAIDKMKSLITANPYVKAFVVAAEVEVKAIDIFHKYWARTDMIYYYSEFEKLQKESDDPDFNWSQIVGKMRGAPEFEFGMTLNDMKEMFKKRYYDRKKIDAKKAEVLKLINLWEKEGLLSNTSKKTDDTYGADRKIKEYFTTKVDKVEKDDYCMRLTRIHKLMERFRKELVVNGDIQKKGGRVLTIDEELSTIVYHYIWYYPDEEGFYKWLAEQGYINKKLEKNVDDLGNKRSWYLVETLIKKAEDETRENVGFYHYTASETEQTMSGSWNNIDGVQQSFAFFSTIQAPPACIEGGSKIVMHCTVKRTSPEVKLHIEVSPWMSWDGENSQSWATVTNLVGGRGVGTRDIHASSGEWDFELTIPGGGNKNQTKKIIFGDACRSQIHWVYKWCSVFEKD